MFFVAYTALAADAAVLFFPPPLIGDTLTALCLLTAIVTSKPAIVESATLHAQMRA